jgi:glutamine cyclotransferase
VSRNSHSLLYTIGDYNRQGLTYANGLLYESTGLYKESKVRILDPTSPSGVVLKSIDMDPKSFGEGMTYWKGKLVQITWKSRQGFIYNATTLEPIQSFEYSTTSSQGWGITWDWCKDEFIVTDGSPFLHFWDTATLQETRKVSVQRMDGKPAKELNEIEYWRGRILVSSKEEPVQSISVRRKHCGSF